VFFCVLLLPPSFNFPPISAIHFVSENLLSTSFILFSLSPPKHPRFTQSPPMYTCIYIYICICIATLASVYVHVCAHVALQDTSFSFTRFLFLIIVYSLFTHVRSTLLSVFISEVLKFLSCRTFLKFMLNTYSIRELLMLTYTSIVEFQFCNFTFQGIRVQSQLVQLL
jgi:hypothetical protein